MQHLSLQIGGEGYVLQLKAPVITLEMDAAVMGT